LLFLLWNLSLDFGELHELLRLLRGLTYYHNILGFLGSDVKNFPEFSGG